MVDEIFNFQNTSSDDSSSFICITSDFPTSSGGATGLIIRFTSPGILLFDKSSFRISSLI